LQELEPEAAVEGPGTELLLGPFTTALVVIPLLLLLLMSLSLSLSLLSLPLLLVLLLLFFWLLLLVVLVLLLLLLLFLLLVVLVVLCGLLQPWTFPLAVEGMVGGTGRANKRPVLEETCVVL
jgi:hypothetical protein